MSQLKQPMQGVKSKAILSTAMLLALSVGGHQAVIAQDDQDNSGRKGNADVMLEEIQVYGTKRSAAQKVQDVPAQISAYSANKLDAMQVVRLTDLTMSTPSVTLDDIGTVPGTANYSIRGLGVNSSIPSIDPAVALFVDGAYVGGGTGSILAMMDMESVEIHKGPQGVLFGRNVTGGAILLRSARPQDEFMFKARAGYETGPMKYGHMTITGPLSDNLSARLAVFYKDDDGYFNSPNIDRDIGREETWIMRPSIKYSNGETFDLTVIYEHGETKGDGPVVQTAAGGNPSAPFTTIDTVQDFAGDLDLEWDQLTVEANMEIGEGTLTNIFAYRKYDQFSRSDIDGSGLWIFHSSARTQQELVSNEIRYNVRLQDNWEMTTGLFYQSTELNYDEGRSLFQDPAFDAFAAIGAVPRVEFGGGGDQEGEIWGVFLNNYFDLSDVLKLQVGARYSWNDKVGVLSPLGTCSFEYACNPALSSNLEADMNKLSPKVSLQYQASDDVKLYTHWARSYRAGGFNFRIPLALVLQKQAAGESLAFAPERVDSFEVGMKSSLLDNRLRLNAAAYVNYLDDMQREINLPDPSGGVLQDIQNTGNARIFGMEFDAYAKITDNFVINIGAGYIDGDYNDVLFDLNGDGSVTDADKDLDIPRLPKWTFTAGFTYDISLGDMGMLSLRGDYAHRSTAAYTDNNVGRFNAYDLLNAGLVYAPNEGNWSLSFFGKNLTDEAILGGMTVLPFASFGAPYFAPMGKGRRWGAEFKIEF